MASRVDEDGHMRLFAVVRSLRKDLSGRAVLNTAFGKYLLRKRWPVVLLAICVFLLMWSARFLGTLEKVSAEAKTDECEARAVHIGNATIHLTAVCIFSFLWWILLHCVHVPLIKTCLLSFESMFISANAVRVGAVLVHGEIYSCRVQAVDCVMRVIILFFICAFVILLDSLRVTTLVKKSCILLAAIGATSLGCYAKLATDIKFFPVRVAKPFWFIVASPREQFAAGWINIALFLWKTAWTLCVRNWHFANLKAPYMVLNPEDAAYG